MFSPLKKILRAKTTEVSTIAVLDAIKERILKLNIPTVADDVDAGYDMAIDEVIDIIDDARKAVLSTKPAAT
jgi:hypothetical protein